MSNFIVPNTFVPGTKAKAQEVNENFIAVQIELNKKAEKEGDPTQPMVVGDATENNHAATKGQVETYIENLRNLTEANQYPFMIKSGNVNEYGYPDIIAYENGVVSFKVDNGTLYAPIVAVPANLKASFTLTSLESIDLSSYPDGTYNIFINEDGEAYALKNSICFQRVKPTTPSLNTIFVNISKVPLTAEKYNGETWVEFNDVHLGKVTLASGTITAATHNSFNDNGYNVNRLNQPTVIENYISGHSAYILYSDGFCLQWSFAANVSDGQVISLIKPYINTVYNVQLTTAAASTSAAYSLKVYTTSGTKTVSGFKLLKKDSTAESVYWRTAGYVAI